MKKKLCFYCNNETAHVSEHSLNFEKLESEAATQKIAILNAKGVKTDEKNA